MGRAGALTLVERAMGWAAVVRRGVTAIAAWLVPSRSTFDPSEA
jgi:hypothetical protein